MKKALFLLLFFVLLNFKTYAADFDLFILNFIQVIPENDKVHVEMALDIPKDVSLFEESLKKGNLIVFALDCELSQDRMILPDKEISTFQKIYFFQYNHLTKQYTVTDKEKQVIINSNARYLLHALVQNINIEMKSDLKYDNTYNLEINVSLIQHNEKAWAENSLFFLKKDIIEPASFQYQFEY